MTKFTHKLTSLPWLIAVLLIAACATTPLYFIFSEVQQPPQEMWGFISESMSIPEEVEEPSPLQEFIKGSVIMLFCVGVLSLIIGVSSAWLVTAWDFKGRTILSILLSLPITVPTYVMAVMYKEILETPRNDFTVYLRENFSAEAAVDFGIYYKYTLAVLILTFSFYPYVFIAARMAFSRQSSTYLESSRMLGRSTWSTFYRVALPLARPAIIAGLMLTLLETMNEFGAMQILGIETLTTGIFKAWLDFGELNSAVRIAAVMMLIVFVLLILERTLRGNRRYHTHRSSAHVYQGKVPSLLPRIAIYSFCVAIIGFAFIIPVLKLVQQASLAIPESGVELAPYLSLISTSSWLAIRAAIIIVLAALTLAYVGRIIPKWWVHLLAKCSLLGYAIPGAILGVVLLSAKGAMHYSTPELAQWIFHTSVVGLILAYAIRFLTVGYNPIEAGLKKINPHLDEASRSLGRNKLSTLFFIHIPLLRHSFLAALIVIFVDVIKELPLTLILGPSNTDTLATKTYGLFAAEERIPEGSIPALILIITSLAGLLIISTILNKKST